MLKQLIDVEYNGTFVLQHAGKGTDCPACVLQTVLQQAQPALPLGYTREMNSYINLVKNHW